MKKKLILLLSLLFVFLLTQINMIQAEEIKNIVYLFDDDNKASDETLNSLESKGITIESINVNQLDYMKYYYLYNGAYDVPENNQALPMIISGDHYYINEDISSHLQEIESNSQNPQKSIKNVNIKMVVYFYSITCSGCIEVETKGIIDNLKNQGIKVIKVENVPDNYALFKSYGKAYGYEDVSTPMIFSGDRYFHSAKTIQDKFDEIVSHADEPLIDVEKTDVDLSRYEGFLGLLLIILGGLVDGVNPCAMAMLVLFIGLLLGTNAKKSTLIGISIAYILGLFITYFALGAFLLESLDFIEPYINDLSLYLNIFIIGFSLFLFGFNLYDFIMSRRQEYGKVKNQLPKGIQKFNKKIIKVFTESLNNKNIIMVYLICFSLGMIISFTEFLCTGQVYLPVLLVIRETSGLSGLVKLFIYNVMFVLPLIILAVLAIRAQSAMQTSNWIRDKLHVIKLITSILFLFLAVYYILIVFGVI